jgi:hypothetical protein
VTTVGDMSPLEPLDGEIYSMRVGPTSLSEDWAVVVPSGRQKHYMYRASMRVCAVSIKGQRVSTSSLGRASIC